MGRRAADSYERLANHGIFGSHHSRRWQSLPPSPPEAELGRRDGVPGRRFILGEVEEPTLAQLEEHKTVIGCPVPILGSPVRTRQVGVHDVGGRFASIPWHSVNV